MAEAGKGWRGRMVMLVGAAVSLVPGWLAWRCMAGIAALAWAIWLAAVAALFAQFAPIAWIRAALGRDILTHDMSLR
ncbi:hypothetical protein E2F46_09720 [Luteimonas aestuarii]|uniref:Uncharacterized protein n=1 Tax=Luteimonas aestuarii TaxID=453837 RepID=A0A4R5TMH1_9GAMM|nr:hypothetical protein [Luteimonas aestuarii]TDK23799.1 hypothetical protein E2F46_09720 [Luteimonas aestuarii]